MSFDTGHDTMPQMALDYVSKRKISSEDLSMASTRMNREHPAFENMFEPILEGLHTGPHIHHDTNLGFETRRAIGITLNMALDGEWSDGKRLSPATLVEWLRRGQAPLAETNPDLYQKITEFYDEYLKPLCVQRFYHSSPYLFDRPDLDKIKDASGNAQNEYGWGFYAANNEVDTFDYMIGYNDQVTYAIDIPKKDLETRWIKADKPIGPEMYQKLQDKSQESPELVQFLKSFQITPESGGCDLSYIAKGYSGFKPKAGAQFMASLGIDGYMEGNYAVFYKPEDVALKPVGGMGQYAMTEDEFQARPDLSMYQARMAIIMAAQKRHVAAENNNDITVTAQTQRSGPQLDL